jgi:hypothetical protein
MHRPHELVFVVYKVIFLFFVLVATPCSAEFRDPTQPGYPLPATTGSVAHDFELVLSAIWISPKSRWAMINGVLVKQGQSIAIGPAATFNNKPETLENTAADNKQSISANGGPNNLSQNDIITPLLAAAINNIAPSQLQGQNNKSTTSKDGFIPLKTDKSAVAMESHSVPYVNTVKIISIQKNSVTVEQNGDFKTLQLVQRPYKTITIK